MKATEDIVSVLCNLKTEQGYEAHFKIFWSVKKIYTYISTLFSVVPPKPF